jgi:RND family efflux transporter MFP subunit
MNDTSGGTAERGAKTTQDSSKKTQTNARERENSQDIVEQDNRSGDGGSWLWAIIGILFLVVGGGVFAWLTFAGDAAPEQSAPQPPLVRVAEVQSAESLEVRQTGFVRPLFEVDIASEFAGRISELGPNFRRGARIAAGDTLVRLDPETFDAELEQAEAQLEQARAALIEARISRNRAEELEDRGFNTEEQLQGTILGVARAEANMASANAGLTRARTRLDDATIIAPFDAVVTQRNAAPGQIVQPGAPMGRLIAVEAAEIEMGLVPPDLALLGDLNALIGAAVEIRGLGSEARQLASGVVTQIAPQIEQRTRTTSLIVRIEDPFSPDAGRPLRVNELVELVLPARFSRAVVLDLPAAALGDRDTVWQVTDGTLRRTEVQVLQRAEDRALVLSDALAPGAQVMISDMAAAFEGQSVRVAEPDAEAES